MCAMGRLRVIETVFFWFFQWVLSHSVLDSAVIDAIIAAHSSNETHACDTLWVLSITENPLSDLRFATTLASMRGY